MPDTSRTNPRASQPQNPHPTSGFLAGEPSDSTNPLVSEFDRGACPDHLATRRQLRDRSVSPGGHDPVGILRYARCRYTPQWSCPPTHRGRAYLYNLRLARPKRVPTLAQEWALDRAMAARQTCPICKRRFFTCLSIKLGCCLECHDGTPVDPASYTAPASPAHSLAA
ncbi:RRQRL motif-containing zinc-binding protein [Streptomyces sp. NPDC057298]|uniref:RRQRL motif-containing zinc-binding protein n=1 Tax=Streptomyces sp. NPDC057298 TaxID=3346091 RepID=UPI003624C532